MGLEKVKVCGVKFFNEEIEGKKIDSGTVFIEESLDYTTGRAKGYATQAYPLGKADIAKALMQNEFPMLCEVEFMRVTNGDRSKNIVASIKPLEPPQKKAA